MSKGSLTISMVAPRRIGRPAFRPRFARRAICLASSAFLLLGIVAGCSGPSHFTKTGSMTSVRDGAVATLLSDGRVLILGDRHGSTSAELYDPKKGNFSVTGSMSAPCDGCSATLLADGRVLIAGGKKRIIEFYDPKTGGFSRSGSRALDNWLADGLAHPDQPGWAAYTATLLADGDVLIVGRETFAGPNKTCDSNNVGTTCWWQSNDTGSLNPAPSAEIYNPTNDTFRQIHDMTMGRANPTTTRLSDGRVLIVGGNAGYSAEIYDQKTGDFSPTGSMVSATNCEVACTPIPLPDGRVLFVGSSMNLPPFGSAPQIYEPANGAFRAAGTMATAGEVSQQSATLLSDGRVLIAGGSRHDWDSNTTSALDSAEVYDPKVGKFTAIGSMTTRRLHHTATLLSDGRVLIAGGGDASAELYQP